MKDEGASKPPIPIHTSDFKHQFTLPNSQFTHPNASDLENDPRSRKPRPSFGPRSPSLRVSESLSLRVSESPNRGPSRLARPWPLRGSCGRTRSSSPQWRRSGETCGSGAPTCWSPRAFRCFPRRPAEFFVCFFLFNRKHIYIYIYISRGHDGSIKGLILRGLW